MPDISSNERPLYLCNPFVKAALVTGKFKTIVQHPRYTDISEWVAMNLHDFYDNLNLFVSFVSEECTDETCPTMSTGLNFSHSWIDKNGRTSQLPARTHIDYIMTWIQTLVDDQTKFPTRFGFDFRPDFPVVAKTMYRQMLICFSHLYHAHFRAFIHTRMEAHFNSLFAHFLAFGREFNMLDQKDLQAPNGAPLGIGELAVAWRELGIIS